MGFKCQFVVASTFLCASLVCAQEPPGATAQMGMWGIPAVVPPHLVIDSSAKPSHHHKASIPNAVKIPVWKQPYAYGYFGATKAHCRAYRSFGHQQSYTEWRLR